MMDLISDLIFLLLLFTVSSSFLTAPPTAKCRAMKTIRATL